MAAELEANMKQHTNTLVATMYVHTLLDRYCECWVSTRVKLAVCPCVCVDQPHLGIFSRIALSTSNGYKTPPTSTGLFYLCQRNAEGIVPYKIDAGGRA